ncbi:MAG TPA: ABC transporter substrate-binding protein [Tepidisphaeraceae bacterium]|jgi:NitT/TauT family transport system substrate-binding protein|nr:ABC transporter substrate-binding protein [Tepidisphaeraceae bacterium]
MSRLSRIAGKIRSLALAFSLAVPLVAAAPAAAEPLKIGYSDWPGWVAWEVAIQKGFFKEAGVDVEFTWFEYGPSMEAFAAGKIDAVTITNGDALVTGAGGKPSTLVVLNDYSNGNDRVVGGPNVKSIKDLKGKSVGVELNFVGHLLLLKGLEANGLSDTDVKLVNFPTNETPQALASGGVDAIVAWYPISGQALQQVAGSTELFTSRDAPGLIYDGLYVSRESLASNRDAWKKVVGVWFKTVDFIKDPATRDESVKIMAARVNVPAEEYAKGLDGTFLLDLAGNMERFKEGDGLDSIHGSNKTVDAFNTKYEVYKEPQDLKSYVDDSLVKEVAAEMKK